MNALRGMLRLSIRGYHTSRSTSARGTRSRPPLEMTQPGMPVQDLFAELEDDDDLDEYETDFKNAAEYDRMHRRELEVQKEKLKSQIVKRKYFKTNEPPMLTWGEKEQIRLLHGEDPEEWTPERLSESFPVSKEGVLKILRSKWSPKSIDVVKRYEDNVKQNWALFKAGKLRMDPRFEAHLQKFKNRRIENTNLEVLAKTLLKPKPEFKKPQSTLFSNIIQSYIDTNPTSRRDDDDDDDIIPDTKAKSFEHIIKSDRQPQAGEQSSALATKPKKPKKLATEKNITSGERMTFHEFLDHHVEKRVQEDAMTPVDRVLVDELKSQVAESYKKKSLVLESASAVGAWKQEEETEKKIAASSTSEDPFSELDEIAEAPTAETSSQLWSPRKEEAKSLDIAETQRMEEAKKLDIAKTRMDVPIDPELASKLEGSLETGIIAREKTEAALRDNYPDYIRIPRKKLKRGVTYRVEDRYYDEDGEFLYRVPVLKA